VRPPIRFRFRSSVNSSNFRKLIAPTMSETVTTSKHELPQDDDEKRTATTTTWRRADIPRFHSDRPRHPQKRPTRSEGSQPVTTSHRSPSDNTVTRTTRTDEKKRYVLITKIARYLCSYGREKINQEHVLTSYHLENCQHGTGSLWRRRGRRTQRVRRPLFLPGQGTTHQAELDSGP
jgi:hypothetical protein